MKTKSLRDIKMREEILKHSYHPLVHNQVGAFLGSIILIITLKDAFIIDHLMLWFAFFILVVAFRIYTYIAYQNHKNTHSDSTLNELELKFKLGVILIGLVWGTVSVFLFPHNMPLIQSYLAITIIILISITSLSLIADFTSTVIIVTLTLTPLIIQLFISDTTHSNTFAVILTIYMALLLKSGNKLHLTLIENIYYKNLSQEKEIISRDNENKYKIFYEKSEDAILIISGNQILMANPAAIALFECSSLAQMLETNPFVFTPAKQPDGTKSLEKIKIPAAS